LEKKNVLAWNKNAILITAVLQDNKHDTAGALQTSSVTKKSLA
jgi:hypothetical protein